MKSTVKERIKEFISFKKMSIRQFERECGLSNGYVNGIDQMIMPNKMSSINLQFPELNMGWLITGEGNMLKSDSGVNGEGKMLKENTRPALPEDNPFIFVPVYNFDTVGGMHASNEITDSPAYIERYVPFTGARKDDICVHVTGNSMIPAYSPGSLLLVRKVEGWMEYFGYGHCFVLFLKDGRRILKEIQKSEIDDQKYVLCVSYNPKNPSEELPRDFILSVYKVIMTLTNEGF
jgi:phage repressor protein C with HTH and peptisase S24 domain